MVVRLGCRLAFAPLGALFALREPGPYFAADRGDDEPGDGGVDRRARAAGRARSLRLTPRARSCSCRSSSPTSPWASPSGSRSARAARSHLRSRWSSRWQGRSRWGCRCRRSCWCAEWSSPSSSWSGSRRGRDASSRSSASPRVPRDDRDGSGHRRARVPRVQRARPRPRQGRPGAAPRTDRNTDLVTGAAGIGAATAVGPLPAAVPRDGGPGGTPTPVRGARPLRRQGRGCRPRCLPAATGSAPSSASGRDVDAVHDGERVEVRVQVRPGYSSDWLPLLGELTSLDLEEYAARTKLRDVRYNQATWTALVLGGVDTRDDYIFSAVLVDDGVKSATRHGSRPATSASPRATSSTAVPRSLRSQRALARRARAAPRPLPADQRRDPVDRRVAPGPGRPRPTHARVAHHDGDPVPVHRPDGPGRLTSRGPRPRRSPAPTRDARGIVEYSAGQVWVELQLADGTWHTLDPTRYIGEAIVTDEEPDQSTDVADPSSGPLRGGGLSAAGRPVGRTQRPAREDRQEEDETSTTDPDARSGVASGRSPGPPSRRCSQPCCWSRSPRCCVAPAVVVRRRGRVCTSTAGRRCSTPRVTAGHRVPDAWSRVAQATSLGVGLDLARRRGRRGVRTGSAAGDGRCGVLGRLPGAATQPGGGAGRARRRAWPHLNPASLLAGWARRRTRPSVGRPGAPRRSPCPESAARGRVTTRPRRGRAARATRARRGRPA